MSLDALAQAGRSGRLLIFAGAGVSRDYGLPDWSSLARALGISPSADGDLPALFSQYAASNGYLSLHELLERKLGLHPSRVLPVTKSILETRSTAIVTTNCDRIFETCAASLGAPLTTFVNDSDLASFNSTPCLRLIKLHGTLDRPDSLVFTKEQYVEHPRRVPGIRTRVAELMRSNKVLFVGFSMADPDFLDLMSLLGSGGTETIDQMVGLFPASEIKDGWRRMHLDNTFRRQAPLLELALEDFGATPSDATRNFLGQLQGLVSPKQLPRLSRQCLILMNGYTATLKTELSTYIANCLSITLLATHRYGDCTVDGVLDPSKRRSRYEHVLEDARQVIQDGRSVILDGTFSEPQWREAAYAIARSNDAHVIVIQTRCEDDTYIRARLWRRLVDHSRSEHEVTKYENFILTRAAVEANPLESDSVFSTGAGEKICFENHSDRGVFIAPDASPDACVIADLIRIGPLMSMNI